MTPPFLPLLGFVSAVANFKLGLRRRALRTARVLKSCDFRQELLLFVVLRYIVLLILMLVKTLFSRYRPA